MRTVLRLSDEHRELLITLLREAKRPLSTQELVAQLRAAVARP